MFGFSLYSKFALFAFAGVVSSQQTGGTYTDPVTGFTFQRYVNGNYTFGLAFPEEVTTDFIGQFSVTGTVGWAGASLGGTMQNSLLVVAYPNGDSITTSLRQADEYANPHLINGTDAAVHPIESGTYVNETTFTITFLCKDCILTDGRTFYSNATQPILGWAHSTDAIADPSSTNSTLNFHNNYGNWYFSTEDAKSPDFEGWASQASSANASSSN
ncbi:GMC oxidoreductase [Seiridium cupressi]